MKSIIVILPYFGKFPNYFKFWLTSCANNNTVNFLIFTDVHLDNFDKYENIEFVSLSFDEFKEKFINYFPFKVSLDNPYKLCDFRPFYGVVLSDYVSGYDFWGYCDCDMIFGDIRKFATNELLNSVNKFLTLGHFSLHRTIDSEYLPLLDLIKVKDKYSYIDVLSNNKNFAIDEYDSKGLSYVYLKNKPEKIYTGFTSEQSIFDDVNIFNFFFRDNLKDKNILFFNSNFLFYRYVQGKLERVVLRKFSIIKQEILYVHLMKRKFNIKTSNFDSFCIVPNQFIFSCKDSNYIFYIKYFVLNIFSITNLKYFIRRFRIKIKIGQKINYILCLIKKN